MLVGFEQCIHLRLGGRFWFDWEFRLRDIAGSSEFAETCTRRLGGRIRQYP